METMLAWGRLLRRIPQSLLNFILSFCPQFSSCNEKCSRASGGCSRLSTFDFLMIEAKQFFPEAPIKKKKKVTKKSYRRTTWVLEYTWTDDSGQGGEATSLAFLQPHTCLSGQMEGGICIYLCISMYSIDMVIRETVKHWRTLYHLLYSSNQIITNH